MLHICGSTDTLIEMMNDCGADAISVDIKNNVAESRKKIGNDVLLFGNFDVFALPCKAETTVEEAIAGVKANIDAGVDAVWPGCDFWPDIKGRKPQRHGTHDTRVWQEGQPGFRDDLMVASLNR